MYNSWNNKVSPTYQLYTNLKSCVCQLNFSLSYMTSPGFNIYFFIFNTSPVNHISSLHKGILAASLEGRYLNVKLRRNALPLWLVVTCLQHSFPAGGAALITLNGSVFTEVLVTCHCPLKHCGKESGADGRWWHTYSSNRQISSISEQL